MSSSVIVVAAGQGERFGGSIPKPFHNLNGLPILAHVLNAFDEVSEIEEIIVVLRKDMMGEAWQQWLRNFCFAKLIKTAEGGSTRADSVWSGFQQISKNCEIVLVHDAARPLVNSPLIKEVIRGAHQWGAVIPALKIKPTVKEIDAEGFITKTHDRERLREAQTPQGFRVGLLMEAFTKVGENRIKATDEALLLELAGLKVKIIEGDAKNIKITTQEDVKLAEMWVKEEKQKRVFLTASPSRRQTLDLEAPPSP
jgi:2-C-methyl-D-erythritol 4-phosphate cytidylyltransferase